ncbi:MAG: methyltransferase domain-containing protein [Pyrinomonadaceae bacterium]
MNEKLNALVGEIPGEIPQTLTDQQKIIDFYEKATSDYLHWNPGFNMHLGYYRRGLNPLKREQMIDQLNLEIGKRLEIDDKKPSLLIDLGCGTGAVSRALARHFPGTRYKGITISPGQVRTGKRINRKEKLGERVEMLLSDFTDLPLEENSADGVWAVESACYAKGRDKNDLIGEMARVLKSGGRFVVSDCFIKNPDKKMNFFMKKSYIGVCRGWALREMPVLDDFISALKKNGFREILVEDISWRVAPTLAQAPFAILSFIAKSWLAGKKLNHQSKNNLKASLLAVNIGLYRKKFSYFLISGKLK